MRPSLGLRPSPAPGVGPLRAWRRLPALVVATALAVMVPACAGSGPPPPWRSGHPDPGSVSLLDSAQAGGCASTAPDPNQAPAAISFQSHEYVQASRGTPPGAPPDAVEVDHTGDWSFWVLSPSSVVMVTPQANYTYAQRSC